MEIQFFLVAFIVSNGLVSIRSSREMNDDPQEIQENLHNLFNSISKNDMQKTGTYRNVLAQQALREKQAFNIIKDTVRNRRQKNADEHRNLDRMSGGTLGKAAPSKREAETPASGDDERNLERLEELFQKKYSSGSGYKEWTELRDANTSMVEQLCSKYMFIHSSATRKSVEGTRKFHERFTFCNRTEPVFEIDTLTCNITLFGQEGDFKGKQKFYLTDGDEPNSAFKFALIEGGIFLTRKVTNIWS